MRAFIAIELSDEIKSALSQIQSHLRYAGADVKWVRDASMHLTLKFLGEIDDERCGKVKSALEKVAKTIKPFNISIKEISAFPDPEHARVVWIGLGEGAKESAALAQKIDDELSAAGFEKEKRAFAAHLTLGRVRSPKNRKALEEKISALNSGTCASAAQELVDSIVLFQSTLTPAGPIYTKLSDFSLSR